MSYRGLTREDIEVFSEAIATFFQVMTRQLAEVRTAYLIEADEPIVWNDFNGLIQVSGGFRGTIAFSAPRPMLREVLKAMGETRESIENYLDIAGEIANQLSGRARKHFGEALDISPPISCERQHHTVAPAAEGPAYAIPMTWGPHEGHLVVHLDLQSRKP